MCQSHWCVSAVESALFFNQYDRTLGTPDERLWPGVSDFPDYKTSFPKWPVQNLLQVIPALSQPGAELLQVIINEIIFLQIKIIKLPIFSPAFDTRHLAAPYL